MTGASNKIAAMNDLLRTSFLTGKVVFTQGVQMLSDEDRSKVAEAVQLFKAFTKDNDSYGEHDFGAIELPGIGRIFWKIDYYDPSYEYLSDDPGDPTKTRRVMTIMLAEEY